MESSKLYPHEWLAIVTLISLLAIVTIATHSCSSSSFTLDEPHYVVNPEIDVFVEGAVEFVGAHKVKRGTLLKDLLEKAQPTFLADVSKVKLETKLRQGQRIKIPHKKLISINVAGAVKEPQVLLVPKGTSVENILSQLELDPEADLEKISSRRLMKDNQKVIIPKKKVLKKSSLS